MKLRKCSVSMAILIAFLGIQFSMSAVPARNGHINFKVRIENISSADGQTASNGVKWPFALSPGFYVVLEGPSFVFTEGRPCSTIGLEAQAEDGNPAGLVSFYDQIHKQGVHGLYNTPIGAAGPGPIGPGGAYEFTFKAAPGERLFTGLMFGQSNDLFYSTDSRGVDLFAKGKPISGDITSKFILWDAGTEVNEEEGIGPNQAPRQKAPNTGVDEHGVIHRAKESRFYSKTAELFRVTITPEGGM